MDNPFAVLPPFITLIYLPLRFVSDWRSGSLRRHCTKSAKTATAACGIYRLGGAIQSLCAVIGAAIATVLSCLILHCTFFCGLPVALLRRVLSAILKIQQRFVKHVSQWRGVHENRILGGMSSDFKRIFRVYANHTRTVGKYN